MGQQPQEEWWNWNGHRLHLDTYRNPQAKVKVILFHGVGTNGRQMSMILGEPLARRGYEAIAVDMPEYGMTEVAKGALVRYDDWVRAGSDLIDAELARDDRPIVLYGLSAGGMLTYHHVATLNKKVKGIVGTTFLDQRLQRVRDETSFNPFMSRAGRSDDEPRREDTAEIHAYAHDGSQQDVLAAQQPGGAEGLVVRQGLRRQCHDDSLSQFVPLVSTDGGA